MHNQPRSLKSVTTIKNVYVLTIFTEKLLMHLWSISSTFFARFFRTNVVLATFSRYMYVMCTWKKLPKWRSHEKFVHKNVDEIDTCGLIPPLMIRIIIRILLFFSWNLNLPCFLLKCIDRGFKKWNNYFRGSQANIC